MTQRQILVVGSQNQPRGKLEGLEDVARKLYDLMIHQEFGVCKPAIPDGSLLLNPARIDVRSAITDSIQSASDQQATLILAFLGHGEYIDDRFYYLPCDAPVERLTSDNAVNLVQVLEEELGHSSRPDGLIVIVDACASGVGAAGASQRLGGRIENSYRYEFISATDSGAAFDLCFSRKLIGFIQNGLPDLRSLELRCDDARTWIEERCRHQQIQHPTNRSDRSLFLCRNAGIPAKLKTAVAAVNWPELERLTKFYMPPQQLQEVVESSVAHRSIAVVAP